MAKGQQLLAEMFGYVESLGGEGIKRGALVPFDHPTSPLSGEEIEDISTGTLEIRRLKKRSRHEYEMGLLAEPRKSTHVVGTCSKCGVPMRADRKLVKHEARCGTKLPGCVQ